MGTQDYMSVMSFFVLDVQVIQPDLYLWLFIALPGIDSGVATPLAEPCGIFHVNQRLRSISDDGP